MSAWAIVVLETVAGTAPCVGTVLKAEYDAMRALTIWKRDSPRVQMLLFDKSSSGIGSIEARRVAILFGLEVQADRCHRITSGIRSATRQPVISPRFGPK
jgi:hypothetical protein